MRLKLRGIVRSSLLVAFLLCLQQASFAEEPAATFSAVIDLGKDRGQSFGSIFEARDKNGRLVAGAGFVDTYNTRFRSDRHTLQFFVRHDSIGGDFTIKRLPHPDLGTGVYLMDLNEKLYAWTSAHNNSVRLWDAASRRWHEQLPKRFETITSGDGAMKLGTGLLVFSANRAWFNDRLILDRPDKGRFYNFYYAHGHLFFFHTYRGDSDGFSRIYACPWTPESTEPINVSHAVSMTPKYVGATPFAWGQYRDEVMVVTNQGGVHVFHEKRWRTLLEANNKVSYQVYSMVNFHDRLLLAQYPTGNLFEYQGKKLNRIEGWPPRLPNVSGSSREAQTMSIYRGDLFVGVWPWAELWRYERDADQWHSLGRAFTHPEPTTKTTHPYEAAAIHFDLVRNHWGQRITSMVPQGDSLMLSTSTKGTYEWFDKYDFITEEQRREYGAVLKFKMPGNLAAQIEWKEGPMTLDFIVESDRLVIRQDGKPLGETPIQVPKLDLFDNLKIEWGRGTFGRLNGSIRNSQYRSN
jgi:hypothetical protein